MYQLHRLTRAALLAVTFFTAFPTQVGAYTVLGTGTASLLGNDLTDVGDDGVESNYNPPADLGGFDATFFSSDEPGFGGGEFAFNVFDNLLGPGNDKWCCGTSFPQIVGADFGGARYLLTHFTISSANDVPGRDPRVWSIEGSNDGVSWTPIFTQNDPAAALWSERLQVIRFDAGDDFTMPTIGFSMFRMNTTATGQTSETFFQVGEIEFFGDPAETGSAAPVPTLSFGALLVLSVLLVVGTLLVLRRIARKSAY